MDEANDGINFDLAQQALTELLAIAEQRFGDRDPAWSVGPIQVRDNGPFLHLNPEERIASVTVNRWANRYENLHAQIAHEVIHLLNPGPLSVNVLEEGVATAFQCQMTLDKFGQEELDLQTRHHSDQYRNAKILAEQLLSLDDDAFRKIREACSSFNDATPEQLMDLFDGLTENTAQQLCVDFIRDR